MIRRRIRSKLQKVLLHDKSGMTLVELMVTFLLLGILMAAAIATLSPAMNVMARISNMSRAQGVADILMEKVCGEVGSSTGQVQIDSGNEKISYTDKKGRSVIMYAKETDGEKRLVLHYQASSIAEGCRTDFADIQNKKECGGNRQWQNHYLRNWAANTKGKGII